MFNDFWKYHLKVSVIMFCWCQSLLTIILWPMCKPASKTLANLVRKTLPEPLVAKRWQVRIVNDFDAAGAELYTGVVYVHASWFTSVYKARLNHVTKHCPLAVQAFAEVDDVEGLLLLRDSTAVTVCRAITIEHTYSRGLFTGALTIGEAFIARSHDGHELYADRNRNVAIKKVLKAIRSKTGRQQYEARQLIGLRDSARQLVTNIGLERRHDQQELVPLAPYTQLLPPFSLKLLRLYHRRKIYPPGVLPFCIIRSQCLEAIPNLERDDILSLVIQLAFDISRLQAKFAERNDFAKQAAQIQLSDDELSALVEVLAIG